MNSHENAKLTIRSHEEMIRRMRHAPAATVAAGFGANLHTAREWMRRYRQGGIAALVGKNSRPRRCRNKLAEQDAACIFVLCKERFASDEIALWLVFFVQQRFLALCNLGCSRLFSLEGKELIQRYVWENPGQTPHLDIKRLGKIDGAGHNKAETRQVCRCRPGWKVFAHLRGWHFQSRLYRHSSGRDGGIREGVFVICRCLARLIWDQSGASADG